MILAGTFGSDQWYERVAPFRVMGSTGENYPVQRIKQGDDTLALVSPRESEILSLIAEGETNKAISHKLCLSESTVKGYISHLMASLQLANRTQLATWALRHPAAQRGEAVRLTDQMSLSLDKVA